MNEALLQAADSRTNEEEKSREVYTRPSLKKLEIKITKGGREAASDIVDAS